jgi:hypothetical protein
MATLVSTMILEIPLHSATSLITNSSTTIYTKSHNCEQAFRNMIKELFQSFNIPYEFDDVFSVMLLSDNYVYSRYLVDNDVEGITDKTDIDQLFYDVRIGHMPKPTWFEKAEKYSDGSSYLYIRTKDPKYDNLAQLIKKFLYSPIASER